jgi:hypothetical protein
VNDKHQNGRSKAQGLPPVAIGVWVGTAHRKHIIKHEFRGLKAQAVIPFIRSVLFVGPKPNRTSSNQV